MGVEAGQAPLPPAAAGVSMASPTISALRVPPPARAVSATRRSPSSRPAPKVAEVGLEVFTDPEHLRGLAAGGALRVHRHGSGQYRGEYLCLRPAGGRGEKRPMLASGRPAKLRAYLSGIGVRLCLVHQRASLAACPDCRSARKGREARE